MTLLQVSDIAAFANKPYLWQIYFLYFVEAISDIENLTVR